MSEVNTNPNIVELTTLEEFLTVVDSIDHVFSEEGKKVTTTVRIGEKTSVCVGEIIPEVSAMQTMQSNSVIALEAAVEAIVNGAEVFDRHGRKIVIITADGAGVEGVDQIEEI